MSPCQCWTNFKTDVPVAVDSSMGRSVNFRIWRLPKSLQDVSQKQDQGYELSCLYPPYILLIPSLQDISS